MLKFKFRHRVNIVKTFSSRNTLLSKQKIIEGRSFLVGVISNSNIHIPKLEKNDSRSTITDFNNNNNNR